MTRRKTKAKHRARLPREESEISLRLEQYDDIFSDFDIRPYSHRALSVDFVNEIKRAAADKNNGGIHLLLHLPKRDRRAAKEATIKERLAAHFMRHYHLLRRDQQRILRRGVLMVLTGVMCMIGAASIIFQDPTDNLVLSFLVVFLEPAAWFLLWEGMDQIIFNTKEIEGDLSFYRKMSHADGHILFRSY